MTRTIHARRRYLVLAVVACAGFMAAILLGGSPDRVVADQPEAVGKVTSIKGGKLRVRVGGEGKARALKEADRLHLGDELIPGKGVEATLKLTRPKGVGDEQLVYVDPKPGETEYIVTLARTGKRTTEVTIIDSTN